MCLKAGTIDRVIRLGKSANVELMTHPIYKDEYFWLMGADYEQAFLGTQTAEYAVL
jgi:hypothetical protein